MSGISTHVLDLAKGKPAIGVPVSLEIEASGQWAKLSSQYTDSDGRCKKLLPDDADLKPGQYRIQFDSAAYFQEGGIQTLYPIVSVTIEVTDAGSHYHIPLLLTANGYSTYRGT